MRDSTEVNEMLYPGEVGVALGRDAVLPAHVVVTPVPVGVVEGRVGEDVVGAQVGMEVAAERVGVLGAKVGLNAAQGEVHHGEAAGGGVALLAVDADVAELAAVGFDEFFRLHEHAAGAAGVRYDDQHKAFYLENPVADSIESQAIPPEAAPKAKQAINSLIANYFRKKPVYVLREDASAEEIAARWLLRSIRIEPGKVVATLSPT